MCQEKPNPFAADWPALLAEQARANGKLLFSLARRVLDDPAAAEDACQKALLQAWANRDDIVDPGRLKGWLARAVINESLAVLRRRKVEHRVLKLAAVGSDDATDAAAPADAADLREAVLLAIAELEEDQRAAVTLRVMHGLPGREVALLLGVSDGQVSKLLHRGMEQLRGTLAQWNHRYT